MRRLFIGALIICCAVTTILADCEVHSYFVSPAQDGVVRDVLHTLIDHAVSSIVIAVYSFTDSLLAEALLDAHARGVNVVIFMDNAQAANSHSMDEKLAEDGLEIYVDSFSYAFHHKFMVIDEFVTVTGSYNWSENANANNFENVVIISCPEIALEFLTEVAYLQGTYDFRRVVSSHGAAE